MITNERYPDVRVAVDYRLAEGLVEGVDPYLEPVADGIFSDDGYFRGADDIASFQSVWASHKPDPDSVLCSVASEGEYGELEYFGVYVTEGRNRKGFLSPVLGYAATFTRDMNTGKWAVAVPFESLK